MQIQDELATDRTNEDVWQYSESFRNELGREPNNTNYNGDDNEEAKKKNKKKEDVNAK